VGDVTEGDVLAPDTMIYAARMGTGTDARFLFLPFDGAAAYARVVDVHGNAMRTGDYHYDETATVLAASNGTGFLELRSYSANPYTTPPTWLSYTLDRDGNVVRSDDPHLPAGFGSDALITDARGGYLLFGGYTGAAIAFIHLDANGMATGPPQTIVSSDPNGHGYGPVTATPTSDGFLASWFDSEGRVYVSRNGGAPVMTFDCACYNFGVDAAYEPLNDLLFLSYDDGDTSNADVYVQKGNAVPVVITQAAQRQTSAAIAAGANGFLVAWTEEDAAEGCYVYVRRYAPDATPLEDVRVAATDRIHSGISHFSKVSVVASGDAYLVKWDLYGFSSARRMDARTGKWIDDEPFVIDLAATAMAAASNGKDALAITVGDCDTVLWCPTTVHPISMSGGSSTSPVEVSKLAAQTTPAIASNGSDYLAVWNECLVNCKTQGSGGSGRLAVMRLHADGTPIDAAPIVLDPATYYFTNLAAGWNGKSYLVTWSTGSGDARAALVGSDGAVQQLGSIPGLYSVSKIVAHAGEFLLLNTNDPGYREPDELRVTLLDGSSTIIATQPSDAFGPIDGASDGSHLMLTYDRVDDAAGRVGRVFIDPRIFPSRKRAVR
jgi:hypothetical protein